MTEPIPEAVTWGLAALLVAVAVLLVRQHGITRRQRGRGADLADGLRARDEALRHLVLVRLPALADSPRQSAPGPLDARLADTEFAKGLEEILVRFSGAVEHAQARADQSAKAALKASMRSIQALANEQQVSISEMQDRHDRPDVLRDLLEIDHTNAQFGRRAQAIAVLCGSWPGRQRATSPLVEVVRGATSRIRDYRRVRVTGQVDIAVESRAVEPVVLAVAELLDNAARHSQPNTHVEVNVQVVHNGACVVVDDAGVGMDGHAVERAGELLSGHRSVDVTRLDDPPQFGFAVIGVLARRYGFNVSVDTRSPYGGVRAVVFVPSALLTHVEPPAPKPAANIPPPRKPDPEPDPEPVAEPMK
ncbi:ATP-binding protein, partial [Streptomyces spongiae]